ARAAAGSDARMSGCPMPVIINSGSGNQGITVTMPVITYAEEWCLSREKLYRALAVSNLVSIYIKNYIGSLSAFCGAVSASCGAGAAITFMAGGDYAAVARTITNTLANVGGIVCDGAKPSCAAKIASSVQAAILAHYMSMNDDMFRGGEGFVEDDVEETIKNMGYIGKIGMKETDREILNVMIDRVDVDSCV
ncbi:MAG: L-serine ammonia-lyase, iron-sulfur-dependent, subunit alpha, partial [Synergistaceae bacterium]|nr:L-serine ammonia-lyase, iron-sulfur-dependent, subunit alpha [Synergistaceae bacterium]